MSVHSRRLDGFTLLELLVTLAVAAILVTIAIPSYRGLVQRNTVTAAVNDLVGDLNYARNEAVTRGQSVYLCQSNDQASCTNNEDWSQGWIVYAPAPPTTTPGKDNLLRVRNALANSIQLDAAVFGGPSVEFDANGFSPTNGTFTVVTQDSSKNKEIKIAQSGRIRIESGTDP